jgi:hypothetical protein
MKLPHRRQFLHLAAGAAALPAVPRIAWAQAYPSRPVRIIVGFAAAQVTPRGLELSVDGAKAITYGHARRVQRRVARREHRQERRAVRRGY